MLRSRSHIEMQTFQDALKAYARRKDHIEMQTFQDALKAYARRKDKDLRTLVRYARLFRVEKILRQYLEVLL